MHTIVLLGSTSASRQQLLKEAAIPFTVIQQFADERKIPWNKPLAQVVEALAIYKMEHLFLSSGKEKERCFVLTADTLSQDSTGLMQGKPVSREDAIQKIKSARLGMQTGTAFCLERKIFIDDTWQLEKRIVRYVEAQYEFIIPDELIDTYLANTHALVASGAITIEGFGAQFLRSVHGSYTTIIGLPLFELRESLQELGFVQQ